MGKDPNLWRNMNNEQARLRKTVRLRSGSNRALRSLKSKREHRGHVDTTTEYLDYLVPIRNFLTWGAKKHVVYTFLTEMDF